MGLKREDIINGRVEQHIKEAERLGLTTRLPPEQRQATKQAILQAIGDGEVWLFGYGSLMWNPCIHYMDRQPALLRGYHRSFCMRTPMGRGTPERPGLMLALKHGGACRGIAFRIDPALADQEFDVVWNREMISGTYTPKLLTVSTSHGPRRAATFVANRSHARYAPDVPNDEAVAMIADAVGWLGSCADYLYNTVEHLDELGIRDGAMHELMRQVQAHQSASEATN